MTGRGYSHEEVGQRYEVPGATASACGQGSAVVIAAAAKSLPRSGRLRCARPGVEHARITVGVVEFPVFITVGMQRIIQEMLISARCLWLRQPLIHRPPAGGRWDCDYLL